MKKMLESFGNEILSKNEMKTLIGGDNYKCQAGNLVSVSFAARSIVHAQSLCNANPYCSSWGNSCTAIVA